MLDTLYTVFVIACLILGFGFVVFFHELGHFLAAKLVGIKVEQFAVGFGQAVGSWRKGMGFTWGSSGKKLAEMEKQGVDVSRFGETEYRINWMPLGGYVKMLGQDDLNPNATADDPRAFNRKSIGARMIVVSAGVIMNVILAALVFMTVYLMGHHVRPPLVGDIVPNSPAQLAGMKVGDRILEFDGTKEHTFTQLMLDIALVRPAPEIPVKVERTIYKDGKKTTEIVNLEVHPRKPDNDSASFYAIGIPITGMPELRGIKASKADAAKFSRAEDMILPGDVIKAVNGTPVTADDYPIFDHAIQDSGGKPVLLSVVDKEGKQHEVKVPIRFEPFFGQTPFNIVGLEPQAMIEEVVDGSPLKGKLHSGDVVAGVLVNGEQKSNPTVSELYALTASAAENKAKIDYEIDRDGQRMTIAGAVPDVRVKAGRRGAGFLPAISTTRPVVARVLNDSPAAAAKIPAGALITAINDKPVENWFDVLGLLRQSGNSASISYVLLDAKGEPRPNTKASVSLSLENEQSMLARIRYTYDPRLMLAERTYIRKTNNPLEAASWGFTETRDMLRQFYVTLRRVTQGRVGASNFMGPIGIVHAGSFFALQGWDQLLWFLAMISANLAVVNFLPIPIVDGGLFVFLIIEKVSGRPLSPRMQTVAQLVGMAIILSVFLLVTYQDIRRLFL